MYSIRSFYFFGFLLCLALLLFAGYLQFEKNIEPCPLCILQRIAVALVGLILLVACLHNPRLTGRRIYGFLALFPALIGGGIAARHVWLTHLPPDQVPACGPGLNYMLQNFPINETVLEVFKGSGECAKETWELFSLNIPEWTLIFFICAAVMLIALIRYNPERTSFR